MADDRRTVFEFIDQTRDLPQKISVESSVNSQYLFHLLIRYYVKKLGLPITFCHYSKTTEHGIKSVIEEHLIMESGRIYIMSGCDVSFVKKLRPPAGTYVMAEATNGELKIDRYRYSDRLDVLRALLSVLGMKMSLRALMGGDWSSMRDYGDFEVVLRKAKVAGWTEEEVIKSLVERYRVSLLTAIKRSRLEDILLMAGQKGERYTLLAIQELLVSVLRYKVYKEMGRDDEWILRELDMGRYWFKELVTEAAAFTMDELASLAKELVDKNGLFVRNEQLGLDLILLGSSVRLTR